MSAKVIDQATAGTVRLMILRQLRTYRVVINFSMPQTPHTLVDYLCIHSQRVYPSVSDHWANTGRTSSFFFTKAGAYRFFNETVRVAREHQIAGLVDKWGLPL